MKIKIILTLGIGLCLGFLVFTTGISSADTGGQENITFDGKGYLRYSYDIKSKNGVAYNEFDIDRIYLGLVWKFSDQVKARYLIEGGDLRDGGSSFASADAAGAFVLVTKQFYVEVSDIFYDGSFFRIGQSDLPWVGYVDGLWGYRLQGPNFSDRSKYLTSTDLGASFGGLFSENYGSWQFVIANGTGWKSNETSKFKDLHARLTFNPFAGNLFISLGGTSGLYDGVETKADKLRANFLFGYKEKGKFTLMGEYLFAKDPSNKINSVFSTLAKTTDLIIAKGFAVYGVLNWSLLLGEDYRTWELIGRFDNLDPDNNISDNSLNRWVLGLSKEWTKGFQTLFSFESEDNKATTTPAEQRTDRVQLLAEVKF